MSTSSVTLNSSISQNLYALQNIKNEMDQSENILSTGKKVNSALDDPISFFAAQDETQRASDLSALKDSMGEGIQTITAANNGVTSIQSLIADAKSLAKSALASSDTSTRADYMAQYNTLLDQIDEVAADSGYNGVNLLGGTGESLTVTFNESGSSSIDLKGVDASTATTGLDLTQQTDWSTDSAINTAITALDTAKSTLRADAKALSTELSTVTARQDFTTSMINTLTTGASNLVAADTNEESANLTALKTQQSLSIDSLSIANTAAEAILKLFA